MNVGGYLWRIIGRDGVGMSLNNNVEMNPSSSRYLVADYIHYRLKKQGFHWGNCPPLEPRPNRIHRCMRTLGDEFEERYRAQFEDMVNQLHITPNIAYPTFVAVTDELFSDGINWGRIVALFAFGGAIAVHCVERDMIHLVDSIFEWVATYIDSNLQQWITSEGGWEGFVEFYERGPDGRNESPWPSLGRLVGYTAGAVGVLALGALLTQKS